MKKVALLLTLGAVLANMNVHAENYQHGRKVYDIPQPGYPYGGVGSGGSQSYGEGGGKSHGDSDRRPYHHGDGDSGRPYGQSDGKNPSNSWTIQNDRNTPEK